MVCPLDRSKGEARLGEHPRLRAPANAHEAVVSNISRLVAYEGVVPKPIGVTRLWRKVICPPGSSSLSWLFWSLACSWVRSMRPFVVGSASLVERFAVGSCRHLSSSQRFLQVVRRKRESGDSPKPSQWSPEAGDTHETAAYTAASFLLTKEGLREPRRGDRDAT